MNKTKIHNESIERLQRAVEEYLNWGVVSGWHSSMFDELSNKIFDRCHVRLSPATLKRFFGVVKYDGKPSTRTLDTLCEYIGADNWRAFKLITPPSKAKKLRKSISQKSIYISIGVIVTIFTFIILSSKRQISSTILDTITFSSRPVTNSYPNSVIFDFNLENVDSDELYIQQYWDATKTIEIDQGQKQATGIYYFPGYFRAKLLIDGQVTKSHDLFLKSNGWLGTIEYAPVPKYFTPLALENQGLTYPTELNKEIEESSEPLLSVYHYINDLGEVSGDDFMLESTIRTVYNEKWAVCQTAYIYLIGTKGAMIIPFSKLGCCSDNTLMLNDVFLDGKKHDLSAFGTDLSGFTDLMIKVENKKIAVSINNEPVYQNKYNVSMGNLVGLRYKFLGLGEVRSFTLKDQNNRIVPLK